MLPEDLKIRAEKAAYSRNISFAELIRESITLFLASAKKDQNSPVKDPFYSDTIVYTQNAETDLSANHDRYLYGEDDDLY